MLHAPIPATSSNYLSDGALAVAVAEQEPEGGGWLAAGSTHPLIPRNYARFWPAGAIAGNEQRAVTAHPRLPFLA
jgi:hypothetical protein